VKDRDITNHNHGDYGKDTKEQEEFIFSHNLGSFPENQEYFLSELFVLSFSWTLA